MFLQCVVSHNTNVQLHLYKQHNSFQKTGQTNRLTDYLIAKHSETVDLGEISNANYMCNSRSFSSDQRSFTQTKTGCCWPIKDGNKYLNYFFLLYNSLYCQEACFDFKVCKYNEHFVYCAYMRSKFQFENRGYMSSPIGQYSGQKKGGHCRSE
jgi:hypothetical protein